MYNRPIPKVTEANPYAIVTIGRGTCSTVDCEYYRDGKRYSTSHISGFGAREAYERAELVIDLTSQPWENACEFSIKGPMHDATLPPGTVSKCFGAGYEVWDANLGDDWRGNASSLDTVSMDVYITLALRFGAHVSHRGDPDFGYANYECRHAGGIERALL